VISSLVLAALFFLALHSTVEKVTGEPFSSAFRLGRGLASLLLTTLGFYALFAYRAAWSTAYVLSAPDAWATQLTMIPMGHFLADFILMGYGLIVAGSKPRKDLCVHHLLGLVAGAATLRYPIAAPQYLLLFTAEMMPVTTGVTAYGAYRGAPWLERLGARLRLAVLVGWRIPLWLWVAAQIGWVVSVGHPSEDQKTIYTVGAAFLVVTLSLDTFWTLQSARALRRVPRP
jgi:hypothetical protein